MTFGESSAKKRRPISERADGGGAAMLSGVHVLDAGSRFGAGLAGLLLSARLAWFDGLQHKWIIAALIFPASRLWGGPAGTRRRAPPERFLAGGLVADARRPGSKNI